MCAKNEKKFPAFVSKYNWNRKKPVILLTIPNREGCRCLEVKNVSELFKEKMSKHDGGIYCLNCLHSFRTENKLELHKKAFESKDFCNIVMPFEDSEIIELKQYVKSVYYLYRSWMFNRKNSWM